jgi:ring-1,2-phenylacetyl-CoA epoxidase subunit PaaE
MHLKFHALKVARVTPITSDAVCITLTVPAELREIFAFTQGQYLTLRASVKGADIRRSYSICNSVQHYAATGQLQVGIKRVEAGAFSAWACSELKSQATLQVMPPQGRFFTPLDASSKKHYLAFAAGSGITPLLSIIATTLQAEPQARFTLVYANRNVASVMFSEALEALKNQHLGRLQLLHLFSRQPQEIALFNGRLDAAKTRELLSGALANSRFDEAFICGPGEMIDAVQSALLAHGVAEKNIHTERFFSGEAHAKNAVKEAVGKIAPTQNQTHADQKNITVILDGKQHKVPLTEDQAVLDAALDAGLDLPYSCKGGVCCTCRAKVLEGSVTMTKNFTLEPWEMEKGFVLTCQAQCTSAALTVSFDER